MTKMYKYEIYCGLPDSSREFVRGVTDTVASIFGDCSVSFGYGVWQGQKEWSLRITLIREDKGEGFKEQIKRLKKRYFQETVLLTKEIVGGEFV